MPVLAITHPTVGRNGVSSVSKKEKDIKAAHQTNKRPHRLNAKLHLSSTFLSPAYNPHQQFLSTLSMYPPVRNTRSNQSPGVIDLPKAHRSPAVVAADKAEGKRITATDAKKKHERVAQVARIENEIRTVQKEAAYPSGGGQKKRVKKTFSREEIVEDSEVSQFQFFLDRSDSPRPQGSRH